MAYQKIKQPKLADVIVEKLEQLILEGSLAPGDRLPTERELAAQFEVSRPSLREAVLRLEAKGLLTRRQGGGTFVAEQLQDSFNEPLFNLLNSYPDAQFDLIEFRHALEGIAAYYAALRGTASDKAKIQQCHDAVESAQAEGNYHAESQAVIAFLMAVTEASHNLVLLHLIRALCPLLEHNVYQNFEILHRRKAVVTQVRNQRAKVVEAILASNPELARKASNEHLAYIEETLLDLSREQSREQRSLRRYQAGQSLIENS